jgi:ABC-type phosphate/phosphonate transport system substrate-binding protein
VPHARSRPVVALLALVLVAVAVVLVLRPGGGSAGAQAADQKDERFADDSCARAAVRFGVVIASGDAQGTAAASRLVSDLAEGLGCRAIAVPYATQASLVTALAMHDVDVAEVDPVAMVVADRVTGAVPAGAYAIDGDTPARTRPAELWVRQNSRIRALADLKDRRVVFGPRLTAGGDIGPRAALLRAGVLRGGAGDTLASGSGDDTSALKALRDLRVDAAITRGAPSGAAIRGLRRIWTGSPALADVMAMRPGIPRSVRRLIQVAVRGLPGAALAPLAARQGLSEPSPLTAVPLDLYAPVAARLDDLVAAGLRP